MVRYRWLSLFCVALALFSCGKDIPELRGIDKSVWVNDRNGCLNKRSKMISAVREEKEKLLALDELKIVAVLGKPDLHEISKRQQKFFYYFLEPAKECARGKDSTPLMLVIRFNAMGLAKEVSVQ